jgi:anti-sigma regulatory factor (Ser/Thr protein kinase)
VSSGTRGNYRHAALFFRSDEEFLARAVPYLQEGLSAGETALIVCDEEHNAQLARALPDDAHVMVLPRSAVYTRAAHACVTYERLIHRLLADGAQGARLINEPPYGSEPEAWRAWTTLEAVSNVILKSLPLSSVCGYDLRALSAPMLHDVQRAHPHLLTAEGPVPSDAYVHPADLFGNTPPPPDPLEATPPSLDLGNITDRAAVARARDQVRFLLDATCPHHPVGREFLGAVAEVMTNALSHGRPPLHMRVWTTSSRLLCTVTDRGSGADLLFAGYVRGDLDDERTRAGLWLARQTCDHLDAYRTPEGFTVRLGSTIPAAPPGAEESRSRAEATARDVQAARLRAAKLLHQVHQLGDIAEEFDQRGGTPRARRRGPGRGP